jgi:DNA-binding NarL/FixJ family response regulator
MSVQTDDTPLAWLPATAKVYRSRMVEAHGATLRVVVADDHHFSREGLRGSLESEGMLVVGEAANGRDAVAVAVSLVPDVTVIDLRMPGPSGARVIREINRGAPRARIAVLTASRDTDDVLEALAAGASSYLLKDLPVAELISAIRLTAAGHLVLSSGLEEAITSRLRTVAGARTYSPDQQSGLSARELAVLRLMADGEGNEAIGRQLSISRHTVKGHVTSIFRKLGVQTRVQAVVLAMRAELI